MILSDPTSNSFHLLQNATVENPTAYHPQLDAFNASLSLDGGSPYAYIEIPQLLAGASAVTLVDQDVNITDLDAFTAYNVAVLNEETVKVDVKGRTALHEMSFPTTTVDYNQVTTMKGNSGIPSIETLSR